MKAINTTLFQNTAKNGFLKAEPKGDNFLGFKKASGVNTGLEYSTACLRQEKNNEKREKWKN